jgi:hypothetical protein
VAYPMRMSPPDTHRLRHCAEHTVVIPGANALTQELTATILKAHGLLAEPDQGVVPVSQGPPIRAATRRRAAALCHALQHLGAQATALCLEAAELCQPHRR